MRLLHRTQLKEGWYLMDDRKDPHKILKILPETPEKYGRPFIVLIEWKGNVPQQLSWSIIKDWKIFDPDQEPEYLL